VIETDHHVGRILDFLEKAGLDENTLIVFSSDNGPEKSWKERIKEFGHDSSQVYQGGKRDIYEGGHRVPFLVRWPQGIKEPGRCWDKPVGQTDLLATFAELMGAKLPDDAGEDSQSFASVLLDAESGHVRLPLINHGNDGRYSVTDGQWKLILPSAKHPEELYDLAADPEETENLVAEYPEQIEEMMRAATSIILNGRTTSGGPQKNDSGYWNDLTWISKSEYAARQQK